MPQSTKARTITTSTPIPVYLALLNGLDDGGEWLLASTLSSCSAVELRRNYWEIFSMHPHVNPRLLPSPYPRICFVAVTLMDTLMDGRWVRRHSLEVRIDPAFDR